MGRVSRIVGALCVLLIWSAGSPVFAGPVVISYDIVNANTSGFGLWAHTYSGTITPTGSGLANYAGGSGTLNDGSHGTSTNDTQLFDAQSSSVITLYLDDYYAVSSISLFGGDFQYNSYPGLLESMYISFGGTAYQYSSTPFGFQGSSGPTSDLFTITGPLSGVVTNQIVLSGFGAIYDGAFSIAEIEVAGAGSATVPDPGSSLLLLGMGLVGLRAWRKR